MSAHSINRFKGETMVSMSKQETVDYAELKIPHNASISFVPNEILPEELGITALNSFCQMDSGARKVMFASHFSQRLVVSHVTPKIIQSGLEYKLAKYTFNIKMPEKGTILKIIDRYPPGVSIDSINYNPETLVIYESYDTKQIGCFTIPRFQSFHQYFGYNLKYNKENMAKLVVGQPIEKDTVFADSPTVDSNGGFNYGTSLNVALMSHPAVSEDGVVISESACKKLAFSLFDVRVIEFGGNKIPLNMYGDINNYKIFPDIGEEIRQDGILMMLRDVDEKNAPVEMGIYDLMEPDFTFDTGYYVRGPHGRVVDIKVYKDDNVSNKLPESMVTSIQKYVKNLRNYHQEIIREEAKIRSDRKKKYGSDITELDPMFSNLVVQSHAICNTVSRHTANKKLSLLYREAQLAEYRVVFTVEYKMYPNLGFKLTDSHGAKGVNCKILPDEAMPVDADGNRAEVIMDSGSVISRMNPGRLYEHYIGGSARDVRKHLREVAGHTTQSKTNTIKLLNSMSPDKYRYIVNRLDLFFDIVCQQHVDQYRALTEEERVEYIADILSDELYVFYPVDNPREPIDIIRNLEANFKTTYGPVSYIGNSGKRVVTKNNVRIAPLYIMLLEKIADTWLSVSYGKMQHFGVLASMTKSEKYTYPYRNNPVKTLGETESRVIVGYSGEKAIAEMMDRANNPITQKSMTWNILAADKPGNIDSVVDRNLINYGGSRPLQLLNHMAVCNGWRPIYVKEKP